MKWQIWAALRAAILHSHISTRLLLDLDSCTHTALPDQRCYHHLIGKATVNCLPTIQWRLDNPPSQLLTHTTLTLFREGGQQRSKVES